MRHKLSNKKKVEPIVPPCRKSSYNTREDAMDMIDYIKVNRSVREIHTYKCTVCGFWHLTSKSGFS